MHSRAARRRLAYRLAGALALAPCVPAAAQTVPPGSVAPRSRACDGDTVTSVRIRSFPPSSSGLAAETRQTASKVFGMPYVATRPEVIRAYLRVAVGRVCTEFDRRESERLLRAQPFISLAAVQAIPETPGHVRLLVDVVDELPLIAGGSVSRGTVSSLLLGTQNFSGRGITLVANAQRGFAYRDGFGLHLVKYGMFGRPDFLAIDAERYRVMGEKVSFELAEPFLTDLQRRAFHASASLRSGYYGVVRPVGEDVSLFVRRTAYDVGWVTRIGHASGRGAVGLVGAALLGEDVRTGQSPVIVSDTGLVAGPANPFGAEYPAFAITRVAAIGGLRSLRFATVHGFDALTAEQDMGIGLQLDLLVGPGVFASSRAGDVFVATDLYAGVGDARSFFVARALAEARGGGATHGWAGVVASGRLAWYGKPSGMRTQLASFEMSAVRQLVFPLQLTFRDADGGLPGFGDATYAGGQRVVARVEERRLFHTFGTRADVALGVFASAGKLWAGDVPYGQTTQIHASAGISLLGAYPSGGKRTYRVDLAVPFNPERGGMHLELRLSSADRTRLLWLEPNDVARARTGAVPVSLMKW